MYQLILRLLVTMCVCMRVVIQTSLYGLQMIKTPLKLPTIEKTQCRIALLTSNNKLPSWKNMEQQQNNMCSFCLFVVGVLVVLMFFSCTFFFTWFFFFHFFFFMANPMHLSSQHWLESPGRFRPSVPWNPIFQPPSRNGDSALLWST